MRRWIALLIVGSGCTAESPYSLDETLRLNHVQAKGTHNSYHLEPDDPFDDSHRFSHAPLDVQLEEQGVRQFELDLHLAADGTFEVFHLPGGVDEETTCRAFVECLQTTKAWSDAHPWHTALVFWLEPKDQDLDWATDDYVDFVDRHDELEAEINAVWPRERRFEPDDLRGPHSTLPEAIRADGWPTLGALRQRAVFIMLDGEVHRDAYLERDGALGGRTMFVASSTPSADYAAFFKVNDAASGEAYVRRLAELGFIVTSNVDGADRDDEANRLRFEASLRGSHYLSSDFPAPVDGRSYFADLPDGASARCHPLTAPPECVATEIEQ